MPSHIIPIAPIPINMNATVWIIFPFEITGSGVGVGERMLGVPRVTVGLAVKVGWGVRLGNKNEDGVCVIVFVTVAVLVAELVSVGFVAWAVLVPVNCAAERVLVDVPVAVLVRVRVLVRVAVLVTDGVVDGRVVLVIVGREVLVNVAIGASDVLVDVGGSNVSMGGVDVSVGGTDVFVDGTAVSGVIGVSVGVSTW
jgi:hypothetical protein